LSNDTTGPVLRDGAFGNATALSCRECGHQVALGPHYACPECFGPLEIAYDFPQVTREEIEAGPRNIWRYKALLPVPTDIEQSPNMEPGFTRLLRANNLGQELGIETLWVKDDSTNPTNSFKDRVVACALSAAREFHSKVFACPSTGNLANAVAAAGARAGIKTVVFIPSNLEQPKIVNSAVYTDSLVAVEGTYDDVNRLASEIAGEEDGWAFVNVNVRPYYAEGSKTLGYEIAEQLGWRLPDQVVMRAGILLLARNEGIFTETAGGTTVAVLKKLVETGQLDPTLETVVINTGMGLKTLDAVAGQVGPAATIAASYDAFIDAGVV
jgi:threonine synthase